MSYFILGYKGKFYYLIQNEKFCFFSGAQTIAQDMYASTSRGGSHLVRPLCHSVQSLTVNCFTKRWD